VLRWSAMCDFQHPNYKVKVQVTNNILGRTANLPQEKAKVQVSGMIQMSITAFSYNRSADSKHFIEYVVQSYLPQRNASCISNAFHLTVIWFGQSFGKIWQIFVNKLEQPSFEKGFCKAFDVFQ
jgi:hypothetical protein